MCYTVTFENPDGTFRECADITTLEPGEIVVSGSDWFIVQDDGSLYPTDRAGAFTAYHQQRGMAPYPEVEPTAEIVAAARALLLRLENITTEEFSRGGERKEREALRALLRMP